MKEALLVFVGIFFLVYLSGSFFKTPDSQAPEKKKTVIDAINAIDITPEKTKAIMHNLNEAKAFREMKPESMTFSCEAGVRYEGATVKVTRMVSGHLPEFCRFSGVRIGAENGQEYRQSFEGGDKTDRLYKQLQRINNISLPNENDHEAICLTSIRLEACGRVR